MIPRTFSLARLMLGITVLCVVLGLAVSGPEPVQAFVLIFVLLSPTGIVYLALARLARNRIAFFIYSALGTLLCCPSAMPAFVSMGPGSLTVWDAVARAIFPIAVALFIGELLICTAVLSFERRFHQATPTDDRLDQQREISRLLRH